ncbi:MAG: ATP-binding protein [Xenococcus sp. (in: cyanobacteria)]
MFKKASNNQKKIKLALSGASGSGKTMTALKIATNLETPIALIDTERGSANVYGDLFDFDICCLEYFSPQKYIEAINYAANAGYKTIIIDSLSHCYYWSLEEVDKSRNSFQGWAKVRPLERKLIDTMLGVDCHLIATMRSKTEWLIEKDRQGRNIPKKIGTAPVQAKDIEYEFDVFGELTSENMLIITKSRCSQLSSRSFLSPGVEVAEILKK